MCCCLPGSRRSRLSRLQKEKLKKKRFQETSKENEDQLKEMSAAIKFKLAAATKKRNRLLEATKDILNEAVG